MRLALKLAAAFLLSMVAVLSMYGYLIFRREIALFESDTAHDQHVLGFALSVAAREVWKATGEQAVINLISNANNSESRQRVSVHWVRPDADPISPDEVQPTAAQWAQLRSYREVSWIDRSSLPAGSLRTLVPVEMPGAGLRAIEIGESLEDQRRYTRSTILRLIALTGTVVAVSGALAVILGIRRVGRPVESLISSARRVAAGDLTARLSLRQHDELGELAVELNVMCDQLAAARDRVAAETAARIATIEQLRHADRLKTVGQLSSGVAHELGTPLNVVLGRAKLITTQEGPGSQAAEHARIIAEQSGRMTRIIRQLLDFARPRTLRRVPTDLSHTVRQTLMLLAAMARKNNVILSFDDPGAPMTAHVDPNQMQQVFSNLVLNGIQAMKSGGTLIISAQWEQIAPPRVPFSVSHFRAGSSIGERESRPSDAGAAPASRPDETLEPKTAPDTTGPDGTYLCIAIEDQGEGISQENQARLFEPFFTTKEVGEGTGLGLCVSVGIVREHGGWIDVASRPAQGSRFSVYLPVEDTRCADKC